jgi:hypothetical protein
MVSFLPKAEDMMQRSIQTYAHVEVPPKCPWLLGRDGVGINGLAADIYEAEGLSHTSADHGVEGRRGGCLAYLDHLLPRIGH